MCRHFCWNGYFGFNIWHSKVKLKWKCKIILGFSTLFLILIQHFIMVAVTDRSKLFSSLLDFSFYVITQLQTWAFRSRNLRSDLCWNRFRSSPSSTSFPALFHCDTFSDWGQGGDPLFLWLAPKRPRGRASKVFSPLVGSWISWSSHTGRRDKRATQLLCWPVKHDGSVTKRPWWESSAWY